MYEFQQKLQSININSYQIDPFIVPNFRAVQKEKGFIRFFFESISDRSQKKWVKTIEKNLKSYNDMIKKA